MSKSKVIWITGLSGAGKTTLGKALVKKFKKSLIKVVFLDGDQLRIIFKNDFPETNSYSESDRKNLASRYSRLCQLLVSQDVYVVISTISLFSEIHKWNRDNIPGYYEIYIKTSIEDLMKRDSKGIYKKYNSGEITNIVGIDIEFDEPISPDLTLTNYEKGDIEKIVDQIFHEVV